jgi:metal-sulfur cluster biosynthetic enzyme
MKISVKAVKTKLKEVLDPELNTSIVDLGFIYDIKLSGKNQVKIVMTLTTIGCPLMDFITDDVKNKLMELGFKKKDISIEVVFDPPWTVEKMSKKARKKLGF